MHLLEVSIFEFVSLQVKQLVSVFAWAFGVLALCNVHVNYANHGHFLLHVNLCPPGEISHLIDLQQRVNITPKLLDPRLDQHLNPILP